jgi:hypothetical protein
MAAKWGSNPLCFVDKLSIAQKSVKICSKSASSGHDALDYFIPLS